MDCSERTIADAAQGAAIAAEHSERQRSPKAVKIGNCADAHLTEEKTAFASFPLRDEVDPNVVIPADVQASIARGEAAVEQTSQAPIRRTEDWRLDIWTAVTDQDVQDARDRRLDSLEAAGRGKRQQPGMINRLRAVDVFIQRAMADGTPFAVGPNSLMNRKVREWLNAKAARTTDDRKSRRKQITAGAVRALLRQIRALLSGGD
ncbi:hypothetical protein [Bradyrhizobium sp. Leo121]|uniref:hypothetical protein n=1 Tax=Bradyrhizobium sp. Leo121 TaxID=1571195 RepID=UPI00102A7A01|nr:hypothetical protein [Bradyrhizobium sp. Leo121]RZN32304.1 hypothetical protein CWO90_13945 [Bradyrhizobium sp. Leo121]